MASVTANLTEEEKRQLGVLAFITSRSGRILAGEGVRMLLKKNSKEIAQADKIRKTTQPEKKNARRKPAPTA